MNESTPNSDFTPEERELARRLRPGSHPSPALLRAGSEGVLPDELKLALRNHVGQCEVCSVLERDFSQMEPHEPSEEQRRRIRAKLPQISRGAAPVRPPGAWRLWVVAGLAAFLIAVGALVKWWPRAVPAPHEAAQGPASPSPTMFAVAKAPIEIPAALLPTRGAQRTDLPSLEEWTLALKPYQEGDFALAVTELASIARKYPRFADGYFYLGVSQLMLQRNADAARSLEAARPLATAQRLLQVQWYLGSAYARLGRTGEAIQEWRSVCAAGSVYEKEACEAISRSQSPSLP